jgi:hypothetical protein
MHVCRELKAARIRPGPITVAAWSRAWTVFVRSNTGVMGSNPTRDMDVGMPLFCVCVVLCVRSGLATGWSTIQGVLPTVYRIKKLKSGKGLKGCRAIDIQGVTPLYVIKAGGDFLGLCDQRSSYNHVPDFGRLRSYACFFIPVTHSCEPRLTAESPLAYR